MDWIELTHLRFDTIVGILPSERVTPQPVEVEIRMQMGLGPIGETGDLGLGIDYAAVEAQITAMVQEGRFWLIETLSLAAVRWLLLTPSPHEERGQIDAVRFGIRKPTILGGRAVPSVWVERERPPRVTRQVQSGIQQLTLVQTPQDAVFRVELSPGVRYVLGKEQGGMLVAGAARGLRAGQRLPRGEAVVAEEPGATLMVVGAP